jgi:hypothetical protein
VVLFEMGILIFSWSRLECDSPIYISNLSGMTDTKHHTQPLVEMGSLELFAHISLEPQSS